MDDMGGNGFDYYKRWYAMTQGDYPEGMSDEWKLLFCKLEEMHRDLRGFKRDMMIRQLAHTTALKAEYDFWQKQFAEPNPDESFFDEKK